MVRREDYVPEQFRGVAFADVEVPLRVDGVDTGRLMLAPRVEARLLQELKLGPSDSVLEIGTGSGYQTAILAQLCRRVFTIERYRTLARQAEERFRALKLNNITQLVADGMKGWPQLAPFDRIIVTAAAAREVPPALLEQLAIGGIMIIPLEERPGKQDLYRITRTAKGYDQEHLLPVRFVPLVEGVAREI